MPATTDDHSDRQDGCERGLDHRLRLRVHREPKRAGGPSWIEAQFLPPCGFITVTMNLAMMAPAQRNCELVADLAAERMILRKAQMMGIAWLPRADQTGLLSDKPHVLTVANTPGFGMGQHGFVDRRRWPGGPCLPLTSVRRVGVLRLAVVNGKAQQLGAKRLLDVFGVGCIEFVFLFEPPMRPFGGRVLAVDVVQFGNHDIAETG